MVRQPTAAAKRASKAKKMAVLKIAVVLMLLLVIGTIYTTVFLSKKKLDDLTLCPADPSSITILLVDVTDAMNVPQKQDFLNQLERLKNSIPRYGKLIVMKVDGTAQRLLTPVIERCNPGTSRDESEATGNPAGLQKKWDTAFNKPLNAAFSGLLQASGSDVSPILESVQSASLTELQKEAAEGKPRRLIVASDLLQNTPDANFYGTLPDPVAFISSPAFRRARTDLRGIDVELWMLQRVDSRETQPRALPDLWDRIISEQGGNLTRIYTISG